MPYTTKIIQRKGKSHILHLKNEAINIWMENDFMIDLEVCILEAMRRHRQALENSNKEQPPDLPGIWAQDASGWFRVDE